MQFAHLLREARKEAGLTQKELAERAGIDHSYISKIERGVDDPPTRDRVLAIIDVLEITDKGERANFLLAAGCASTLDGLKVTSIQNEQGKEQSLPFAAYAFHFKDPNRGKAESIVERIYQLVENPELTDEQLDEVIQRLDSFVAWLEFEANGRRETKSE